MANSQTWHCAVCGSTNTIADTECETCKSPRAAADAGRAGGVARGVRVEASRGHGPNSPYAAMLEDAGPTGPGPVYRPAPVVSGSRGFGRAGVGVAAGLAILAGGYFLYQYYQSAQTSPPPQIPPQVAAPGSHTAVMPGFDPATWAASASLEELRAAVSAGGPRGGAAQTELTAREDLAWRSAAADGSIERLSAFLQEWPNGARAGEARTQISSLIVRLPSAPFSRRVVSSARAAMREAPASNAAVIAYLDADQPITPRRSVRNNNQNWFVLTHTDGRLGYVSYQGFRYADRAPVATAPPVVQRPTPPPPRASAQAPPSASQSMPGSSIDVREARPARAIRVEYPSRARGNEIGVVEVEFIVTVSGAAPADFIEVLSESPPGRGFGEAVRRAIAESRFTPRTVNGTPEPSRVRRTFRIPPP